MGITTLESDSAIQSRVQQELEWNPHVDEAGIAVKVRDGVVTLTGVVDSYAKKLAACSAVQRVAGARDVADELEVRAHPHAKSDQEIAQAVRSALVWDVYVPDQRIKSRVSDGWVTLEGDVDRWQEREDAARCVERLKGVSGVSNRLEVKGPSVDAAKIRAAIEGALTRRAEREAKRLSISVAGGVVTLKGSVDSWAEKNAIERLAACAPGVQRLENEILVDPYL